jgi:hypothetical protein
MKVLLDECVNRRLARRLIGHDVSTTGKMGWNGILNGQLLARAVDAGFGAFVTIDKSLSFQNHIGAIPIAVFVLRVRSNRMQDLNPLVDQLLTALASATPRTATVLGS